MTAVLRARGPYALRGSARGDAGGTRRARGGVVWLALRPGGAAGAARVRQRPDGALEVEVVRGDRTAVVDEVRRVLRLDLDTGPFAARFRDDPLLGPLLRRRPGFRPALLGTVAQALLAAVAGQLVSWRAAAGVERRVVARAAPAEGALRLPPTRAELAVLAPADLAACGLTARRAAALARAVRAIDTEGLARHPSAAVAARLVREPGLGPWSAGVVGLLGLGRVDMPLTGDLALVRLASRRSGRRATADDTRALLAPYGEWAGLAGAYLLAHPLSAPGPVPGG